MKTIKTDLTESTIYALKQAVESLEERCGVVVSLEELAALCVETTVAKNSLAEIKDDFVLNDLAKLNDQLQVLEQWKDSSSV